MATGTQVAPCLLLTGANLWDQLLCHCAPEPSMVCSQYSFVGKSPCVWLGLGTRWPFSATGIACSPQCLLCSGRGGNRPCYRHLSAPEQQRAAGRVWVAEDSPENVPRSLPLLPVESKSWVTWGAGILARWAGWAAGWWVAGERRDGKAATVLLVSAEETS